MTTPRTLPRLAAPPQEIDYQRAFNFAPLGLILSRHRTIVDCNEQLAQIFRTTRAELLGASLAILYPNVDEFERIGARIEANLDTDGRYADDRIMKRQPGCSAGDLFWCHVVGRAFSISAPHRAGIWAFEDLSAQRPLISGTVALTPRERDVAALLIGRRTSKQIGELLSISHRTVEIHRANLMRKYEAQSTDDLLDKLMHSDK